MNVFTYDNLNSKHNYHIKKASLLHDFSNVSFLAKVLQLGSPTSKVTKSILLNFTIPFINLMKTKHNQTQHNIV